MCFKLASPSTTQGQGNTLLLVAGQNGLKRISKMLLRFGANVNAQNERGQTALHFCFSYGFLELAESVNPLTPPHPVPIYSALVRSAPTRTHIPNVRYFIRKGGNDTLTNADGLTCYEGLTLDDLEKFED